MDILTKSLNQGVPVDIIYMDLQKAFDTVLHKHLLYVNEYYGITDNFLRWIAGFLSNRRQCIVFLNGKNLVGSILRAVFLKDQFRTSSFPADI